MIRNLDLGWREILSEEFQKDYFKNLSEFVDSEYAKTTIYPPYGDIFSAFRLCSIDNLKVVILGQDPYHGENQAHGLAFSVNKGVKLPPSLVNIFKEINSDLGKDISAHGNLSSWAEQGVLLMNATLSVRAGEAGSHQKRGWEEFTDAVIREISLRKSGVVFILWGSYAQKKDKLIDSSKHLILKSAHPSPLSSYRGFFGCQHFSKTNNYLNSIGKESIIW